MDARWCRSACRVGCARARSPERPARGDSLQFRVRGGSDIEGSHDRGGRPNLGSRATSAHDVRGLDRLRSRKRSRGASRARSVESRYRSDGASARAHSGLDGDIGSPNGSSQHNATAQIQRAALHETASSPGAVHQPKPRHSTERHSRDCWTSARHIAPASSRERLSCLSDRSGSRGWISEQGDPVDSSRDSKPTRARPRNHGLGCSVSLHSASDRDRDCHCELSLQRAHTADTFQCVSARASSLSRPPVFRWA